jgi:hemolysin activation/secretion protein
MHSLGYFSKSLDESELIRIGGPNSIRGFNTESLFVQQWNGFQSEFGYQLLNVFGYLFVDGGYRDELAFRQLHHSYGLGAKIDRNGIMLSLAYGWGVFPGQGLDLRQGVFHIGLNQKF